MGMGREKFLNIISFLTDTFSLDAMTAYSFMHFLNYVEQCFQGPLLMK